MLAHAFARIEAARLAPIGYVTLVWGVLFGFLFFAEVPGLATLAGARLIVLGTLAHPPALSLGDRAGDHKIGQAAMDSGALMRSELTPHRPGAFSAVVSL